MVDSVLSIVSIGSVSARLYFLAVVFFGGPADKIPATILRRSAKVSEIDPRPEKKMRQKSKFTKVGFFLTYVRQIFHLLHFRHYLWNDPVKMLAPFLNSAFVGLLIFF